MEPHFIGEKDLLSPYKPGVAGGRHGGGQSSKGEKQQNEKSMRMTTVLFVEFTKGGELQKRHHWTG